MAPAMNMQIQGQRVALVLVAVFCLCYGVESIRLEVESGRTKCIAEDIKKHSMTVGKYHIVNPKEGHPLPDSHKITVRVTSARGNSYHYADHVTVGNFAYQTMEAGNYMACFLAAQHNPPTTLSIEFDWRSGIAAKDWGNVAKRDSVELMEIELKKMLDTVQSINEEMYYLREREQEMQQLNRSTNNKMLFFSLVSILICLFVSGLQLRHLKIFFEKKKVI